MHESALSVVDKSPLIGGIALIVMALVPIAMLGVSSFVKLHVVFSILRNALGAQQVPSGAVIGLLSLALTAHIMGPIAEECFFRGQQAYAEEQKSSSRGSELSITASAEQGFSPLKEFLKSNASFRERVFFASMKG